VWWPVVHGRYSAGAKAAYLFAAFVLASPLGLLMALIPRAIYPFYVHAPRLWGLSPVHDQNLGGVLMTAEQSAVFLTAVAFTLLRLLDEEERRNDEQTAAALEREAAARDSISRP